MAGHRFGDVQPKAWPYKTAYTFFAILLVVVAYQTLDGLGDWAWNSLFGDDTSTAVSVDPTPTHDTAEYPWPH